MFRISYFVFKILQLKLAAGVDGSNSPSSSVIREVKFAGILKESKQSLHDY